MLMMKIEMNADKIQAEQRYTMSAINRTGMQERSRKLDDRKTKDYWTTKPEMSARAFESYVISKLQDQNAGNDYLANVVGASVFALEGGYPYPTAGEMPQIRGAFDAFFQTVETREESGATVLYSTSDSASAANTSRMECCLTNTVAAQIAAAMMPAVYTADSNPTPMPESTTVAAPV